MAAPTKKVKWISQFKLSRTESAHLLYGTQTLNYAVSITAAVFVKKLRRHNVWYIMVADLPRNNHKESKEYATYIAFHRVRIIWFAEVGTVLAPSCEKIAMDNVHEPRRRLETGDENSLANLDLL